MSDLYESAALVLRFLFLILGAGIFLRAAWETAVDSSRARFLRQAEEKTGAIAYFSVIDARGRKSVVPLPREGTVGAQWKCDVKIGGAGLQKKHFYYEIIDGGIVITPLDGEVKPTVNDIMEVKKEEESVGPYDKKTFRPGRTFSAGSAQFKYVVNRIHVKPVSPALKRAYGSITAKLLQKK